jgi:hypothetical protein
MAESRKPPVPGTRSDAGIGRRNVLQGLLSGVGAGLAVPGLAAAHPLTEHAQSPERIEAARTRASGDAAAEALDAYQMQMFESLAERIVPGATAAGCARFVDSLLAVGARADLQAFLTALGAIDAEARRRFGGPWAALDEAQQVELLEAASSQEPGRPARGAWTPGTPVAEYLARPAPDAPTRVTLRDHFDTLKGWVVGAYYSSEPGMWDLGYTGMSFGATFRGCSHPDGHREG